MPTSPARVRCMLALALSTAPLLAGCGSDDGVADDGTGTDGGTDGTDPPEPLITCETTSITMGVFGQVSEISCDVGPGPCIGPATNFTVTIFDQDPQLDGMLDPAAVAVAEAPTDSNGEYELELPPGTYFVCEIRNDRAICAEPLTISDAEPRFRTVYRYGNGDVWSVSPCP